MWRTLAPVTVLIGAVVVLLVPFHPEAAVLHAVIAVSPRTPIASRVDWFLVETGGNFAMFAAVGAAARLLLRRTTAAFIVACLVSAGAELAQIVIPSRVASWSDFVTNVLGAITGVILASVIATRLRRTNRDSEQTA